MGLRAVLVDRARPIRNVKEPLVADGRTLIEPVRGEWFRCRLTVPAAPVSQQEPGSHRRAVRRPTLLLAVKDLAGERVNLTINDRLEVISKEQLEQNPEQAQVLLDPPTGLNGDPHGSLGALLADTYFYRVTAVNSLGETTASVEIAVVVTVDPTADGARVNLHWNEVPGALSYRVYRGTLAGVADGFYVAPQRRFLDVGEDLTVGEAPDLNTAIVVPARDPDLWEIVEQPRPIRKRRSLLGWEVTLKRVEDVPQERPPEAEQAPPVTMRPFLAARP